MRSVDEIRKQKKALTVDELKSMSGQPVYCPEEDLYGIISCDEAGRYKGIPFLHGVYGRNNVRFEWDIIARKLKLYRVLQEE